MNVPQYKRLPGRGRTWTGTARLWLGADHILSAQTTGYSEVYKRFFFPDIQAITVCKTDLGKIWNAVLGVPAAFFALLAVFQTGTAAVVLLSIAGLFALPLVINVVLGATCMCHVRTAVQSERLHALSRMRAARRVVNRIRPLIVAAQGEISREQLVAELGQSQGSSGSSEAGTPPIIA